jgi:uncharacterized ferredoxin-like protein
VLRVRFFRVRPEQLERLRSWMAELSERRDEVLQTFQSETVRHEAAYLLEGNRGPVLVYIVEAEDLERAARAVEESPFPIDLEHRAVLREVLLEELPVETLFDESV